MKFKYSRDFSKIDFRKNPELYQVGKGEQGVLLVEPYKSEILPLWRFKTPNIAKISAESIYNKFLAYKENNDFVGMDMARKFLQMGWTRSKRYANHKSGRKYSKDKQKKVLPLNKDEQKAESAKIFFGYFAKAKDDSDYLRMKENHQRLYEGKKL